MFNEFICKVVDEESILDLGYVEGTYKDPNQDNKPRIGYAKFIDNSYNYRLEILIPREGKPLFIEHINKDIKYVPYRRIENLIGYRDKDKLKSLKTEYNKILNNYVEWM